MAANPEPDNRISLISSYSTIAQTHTNRIDWSLGIDTLKVKTWMVRVLFEKLISFASLLLDMHR